MTDEITDKISLGDLGTDLQATIMESDVVVDISAATVLQMIITKPSGGQITRTALLINTGTDGQLHYTTVSGDIDEKGVYSYKGKVTFSATQVYTSIDAKQFEVV